MVIVVLFEEPSCIRQIFKEDGKHDFYLEWSSFAYEDYHSHSVIDVASSEVWGVNDSVVNHNFHGGVF